MFDWPIDWGDPPLLAVDDPLRESVAAVAIETLWAATGRRYGLKDVLASPRPIPCPGPGFTPHLDPTGRWLNTPAWRTYADRIYLAGPVYAVGSVTISGALLDPGAYTAIGSLLLRTDGRPWPVGDDWTIGYTIGNPIGAAGARATGILAAELAKARRGTKCRLPNRATSISREGVDVQLSDPETGLTGLAEVDAWIQAVNPELMAQPARVWSPDLRNA